MLTLKLNSDSEKKACQDEGRHWQRLLPDTPVLVENLASGICVVTTTDDYSHQLWHLSSSAAIDDFQHALSSQAHIAIQLIIGHTDSKAINLDQATELAGSGQVQLVKFYPFYAEVRSALERCYPKIRAQLCSHYLINQTRHLSLQLQQGQLHLESIHAYRLKPSQAEPGVSLLAPKPIRHRRNSFSANWESLLVGSSLSQPMPSTSPPLPTLGVNKTIKLDNVTPNESHAAQLARLSFN